MKRLTLADVIEGVTGHQTALRQPISKVVIDSREAIPGALFVALPGTQVDGHDFVADAFQRGAIAALVQRPLPNNLCQTVIANQTEAPQLSQTVNLPLCVQVANSLSGLQQLAKYWREQFTPRVIGITGSVGKSTTKELTASVLSKRYRVLKTEGNFNNEIGLPLTLLKLNEQHEQVVLEMGMYDVGEITLLCKLAQPHVGLVTNVGPTHLERLGTFERIAQAKSELVAALPPATESGVAILNQDDALVRQMAQKTEARVVTYGLSATSHLWASDITSAGLEGVRFIFHRGNEALYARVPLLGRHSVHTALRAALVGLVEGLAWEEIMSGLQSLAKQAQLRLVAVPGPNQSILLDDTYNASPASTIAALNLLDDLAASRKIAILGDMLELGSFEEAGHRKVGCRAADVVDLLITIGSRSHLIALEAQACGLKATQLLELDDNQAAVSYLKSKLSENDVVLIKGSNSQKMEEIVSALAVTGQV